MCENSGNPTDEKLVAKQSKDFAKLKYSLVDLFVNCNFKNWVKKEIIHLCINHSGVVG